MVRIQLCYSARVLLQLLMGFLLVLQPFLRPVSLTPSHSSVRLCVSLAPNTGRSYYTVLTAMYLVFAGLIILASPSFQAIHSKEPVISGLDSTLSIEKNRPGF